MTIYERVQRERLEEINRWAAAWNREADHWHWFMHAANLVVSVLWFLLFLVSPWFALAGAVLWYFALIAIAKRGYRRIAAKHIKLRDEQAKAFEERLTAAAVFCVVLDQPQCWESEALH